MLTQPLVATTTWLSKLAVANMPVMAGMMRVDLTNLMPRLFVGEAATFLHESSPVVGLA